MTNFRKVVFSYSAVDLTISVFLIFLSLIDIIYSVLIPHFLEILIYNAVIIAFIYWLNLKRMSSNANIFNVLEYLYLPVMIFFVFKELYFMVDPINGVIYDWYLINVDQFLFGVNPTYVLYKIANPVLTEILQLAYSSYYFLPIILAYELIKRGEVKNAEFTLFLVFYGFFLSYLGYLTIPAIGPRFTLHNFKMLDKELPGIFVSEFIRNHIINPGEGVTLATRFPMLVVQRDAFPSGHTEITLIVMYASILFKAKSRFFIILVGILLIFATIYLRYHYVIDLIAGSLFMIYTIWSGKILFDTWEEQKRKA